MMVARSPGPVDTSAVKTSGSTAIAPVLTANLFPIIQPPDADMDRGEDPPGLHPV